MGMLLIQWMSEDRAEDSLRGEEWCIAQWRVNARCKAAMLASLLRSMERSLYSSITLKALPPSV